jgi:hypothetical protein
LLQKNKRKKDISYFDTQASKWLNCIFLVQTIGIFGRFWPSVPDGVYLHVLSFCIEPSAPLRVHSTYFAKGYIQMEKNTWFSSRSSNSFLSITWLEATVWSIARKSLSCRARLTLDLP